MLFAEGPRAWLRLDYTDSKSYEDGDKTNESDRFFQNYYFQFDKTVNPLISYNLYLRGSLTDSHFTDSEEILIKKYERSLEPAINIQFRNPMYGLNLGYRRHENWSTARITNESRLTRNYYYARFDLTPTDFPYLSLQFDTEDSYDHLSERKIDIKNITYLASSWYNYQYKGLEASYNLTFSRNEEDTPLLEITETLQNNFTAAYDIKYHTSFWRNIINFSAGYLGNYNWNEAKLFSTETGPVPFKRTPSLGMYGLGTSIEPEVDTLSTTPTLSDEIYDVPASTIIGSINLGSNGERYNNIGIQLFSSDQSVDALYIYVNEDVSLDTVLSNPNNWIVYASNFNLEGTWTEVAIQSVTITEYFDEDIPELVDVYRYEIRFTTPQNNLYFNAINLETVLMRDVFVTEIEAYGTEDIPETGELYSKSVFFSQGLNFNASIRPLEPLMFSFDYYLNRADQNPISFADSVGGVFKNIFSKSLTNHDEKLKTNVTRSYGAGATWLASRMLTTTLRAQRSESFDNKDETDYRADTYSLGFYATPLQTLTANLTLTRTYSYTFNEKQSMSNLYLLTLNARLYKGINMVTDIGYTKSNSYHVEFELASADSESSTKYINGTIEAILTPELSTNLRFGVSRTSTGDLSNATNDGGLIVTYRPGRFISFTGGFSISDVDGDVSTREGIQMDWLFLPTVRFNALYEHSNSEPGSGKSDELSGYLIWYITKFMNLQVTSRYNRTVEDTKLETYTFGANLTCRFW
jgi:hypothetical protein